MGYSWNRKNISENNEWNTQGYKLYISHNAHDVGSSENDEVFDITSIAHNIRHFTSIFSQPGKFTFTLDPDPNYMLKISVGSIVMFYVDGFQVFGGRIFNLKTNEEKNIDVICYDKLRYFENKTDMIVKDKTASEVFEIICKQFGFRYKIVVPSTVKITETFIDKTLFEIIQTCINKTYEDEKLQFDLKGLPFFEEWLKINDGYKYFFIRDNLGVLEFTEIGYLLNLQIQSKELITIGSKSLMTNYEYEIDIDKDTCNSVIVKKKNKNKDEPNQILEAKQDKDSIRWYGLLEKVFTFNENTTDYDAEKFADGYLQYNSRAKNTLKVTALGVTGLTAGMGVMFSLKRLMLREYLYIEQATHNFDSDVYTMELELSSPKTHSAWVTSGIISKAEIEKDTPLFNAGIMYDIEDPISGKVETYSSKVKI